MDSRGGDVPRLAHDLEGVSAHVVRRAASELRHDRRGYRGRHDTANRQSAEHTLAALDRMHRNAARYNAAVQRTRRNDRQPARRQLEALLQSFYDADRALQRGPISHRLASDFERSRWLMDTLVARHGGYRNFAHVHPSRGSNRTGYDRNRDWDRDDRGRAGRTRPRAY
ncbi:MAG TPA: hypothetical protein VMT16_10765 [Thermoanaerobaculia bacterium]|nr:hypothetical protein [Thermoanaerobaculia bacterium]